ncbi:hypothetical protein ACIA03_00450 [Nocardioides sp. NPDC051685]|uniref:hypothetical protein n=1 Tax=Nocardioides sp. NPDC051685 TaxID=3364334 RepID=UPI0037942E17
MSAYEEDHRGPSRRATLKVRPGGVIRTLNQSDGVPMANAASCTLSTTFRGERVTRYERFLAEDARKERDTVRDRSGVSVDGLKARDT